MSSATFMIDGITQKYSLGMRLACPAKLASAVNLLWVIELLVPGGRPSQTV